MRQLFRDGYWRDMVVLLFVTIVLGSLAAWTLAWGVDTFFGDAVSSLVGEAGEYDVMIQIRSEHADAAEGELQRIIDEQLPGTGLHTGVSVAGQTVYFLKLPSELRSAETFSHLGSILGSVTGFIGHTLLLEPSIVISGIHDSIAPEIAAAAQGMTGVDFVFRNGANLIVALTGADSVEKVQTRLSALLAAEEIVEVRLPLETAVSKGPDTISLVEDTLRDVWGPGAVHSVEWTELDERTASFHNTLREMRRFLLGYATRIVVPGAQDHVGRQILLLSRAGDGEDSVLVQLEGCTEDGLAAWGFIVQGTTSGRTGPWIAYAVTPDGSPGEALGPATVTNERSALLATLDESIHLLSNLSSFAAEARLGMEQAEAILAAFDEAVGQLQALDGQIQLLEEALASLGGTGEATAAQALLSVLVSGWLNRLSGGEPPKPTAEVGSRLLRLDLPAIEETLRMLAEGVADLAALDVDAVIFQIEQLKQTLPLLDDEEIARSIRLIDENLHGGAIPGDRLAVRTEPGVSLEAAEKALARALAADVYLVKTVGGMITPNARVALSQILGQVRELVAALAALIVVLLTLFLDHSVLFSLVRKSSVRSQASGFRRYEGHVLGIVTGAFLLLAISFLAGGRLPIIGWTGTLVLGALVGAAVAGFAERISPINWDEVVAGEALGLTHADIMREIVVPSARPGLLTWLNRRRQRFRSSGTSSRNGRRFTDLLEAMRVHILRRSHGIQADTMPASRMTPESGPSKTLQVPSPAARGDAPVM